MSEVYDELWSVFISEATSFFYRHLLLLDLFFISVTNLYTHRFRLLVWCCLNAMHLKDLQNFLTKSLLGTLAL